jgi:hypothetical protein
MMGLLPARQPCSTCPYRRDVPSGVWDVSEYDKLPGYDGEIASQAMAGAMQLFDCHQRNNKLCAGWVGCHDMHNNLAVRLHYGDVDPAIFDYVSPVPLFASGYAAAEHGKRDIEEPGPEARRAVRKVLKVLARRGMLRRHGL